MRPVDPPRDMTRIPDDPSTEARRPAAADNLRQRLDHLPPGHPSSPHEADRSHREPTRRLRDSDIRDDTPVPPDRSLLLSNIEWSEHQSEVRFSLATADDSGLQTDHSFTTDNDRKIWTTERNRAQAELVADVYEEAKNVPCDSLAIIAGGLPGAGKSTILSKQAGIDLSKYLTINPDDIKEKLAERDMIPHIEGLSPMEATHLAHEEASLIAKRLALRAVAERKNIIWDITMSSRESTEKRITQLHDAGYSVEGIFVDIPPEISISRTEARHREDHEKYRAGIGLGGRYIPPEVIQAQADAEWGSKNRRAFEDVTHLLQCWRRYDNSVDGRSAELMATTLGNDQDHEETA